MLRKVQFFSFFLAILLVNIKGQRSRTNCPGIFPKVFKGHIPRGNFSAGNFTKIENAHNLNQCVATCCQNEHCNAALINGAKCFHIVCVSNEMCLPVLTPNTEAAKHVGLVLVKPVGSDETWGEILNDYNTDDQSEDPMNINGGLPDNQMLDEYFKNMMMDESSYDYKKYPRECDVNGPNQCPLNEECAPIMLKSSASLCRCKTGYSRNGAGTCRLDIIKEDLINSPLYDRMMPLNNNTRDTSSVPNIKQLTVSVNSKEVRLPENEATLAAYVVPVALDGQKYRYEWTLLQKPAGSNSIKDQNESFLRISQLSEGLYTFKVTVTGEQAFGETYANLTVLPPKRINKPPQVIINPSTQTVKLPNTGAVLDASGTKDDAGIVSWHWELQQGPLGYQPHLVDTPTLQLNNLNIPGNYTFKVIVTDSDHATNSSTANITVLQVIDYPPEANAGQDVIIYLPRNKVTLNGNMSRDDREIVAWEWTKSPSDADKAADMQDTRTPYLRLSDLEEGMYTFILKVTDSANQSGTSEVHVFVKPATNHPPKAEAGENITISLPQTSVTLDGSNSKDDDRLVSFKWEQIEGPSNAAFSFANISSPNVTSLTKGHYIFKLTVTDNNGDIDSDTVSVLVTQNKNQRPKANAGGDQSIVLPVNVIFINGSKSSDDLAITKWKWMREDGSLAVGNIVKDTEETPVLMLTNVVPGRYVFQLTVWDEQGLSDTDTVSVMVKEDPQLYQLVELTVEVDSRRMTELQFRTLQAKLALLIKDDTKLHIQGLRSEPNTGRAVIVFFVESSEGSPVAATEVVHYLKQKLVLDESLLGFSVASLKTTICQNKCSDHGSCNEQTRKCLCEAFWMQDIFRLYLGDGEADCNWSVLYVVVGLFCAVVVLVGVCWGCGWLCMRLCSRRRLRRKPQTYSLLGDTDEPVKFGISKNTMSDTDTDSDVLFESRSKSSRLNGDVLWNGVNKNNRNGLLKLGRRVKT